MKMSLLGLLIYLPILLFGAESNYKVFSKIYDTKYWGTNSEGEGYSGPGSLIEQTVEYRQFLQQFMKDHEITSVVDMGCGDWTFSKTVDWTGIRYHGCDVVASVIEKNQLRYSSPTINFSLMDGSEINALPPADLLLCKDVLQHLSFNDVEKFFQNLNQYKYCLITNDIAPSQGTLSPIKNSDISSGDHRYLDITKAPFSLVAEAVLTYQAGPCLKQTLLIKPPIKRKNPIDLTIVGPVGNESLCQFPKLWAEVLSDKVKMNLIATSCRYDEASPKVKQILSQGLESPGNICVFFENVWSPGVNHYEVVPIGSPIKIAFSSYESSILHPKWVEIFNTHFDAVVVLDPYYQEVYVASGVKVPVFVMPQVLDLNKYHEEPNRTTKPNPLVFGCSAAFWDRKNLPLLLSAFANEFGNSPDVHIKIHGRGGMNSVINNLNEIISKHQLTNAEVICRRFTTEEYDQFLKSIDVYALLSQGEGYSISPREAMSLGIPCILSDNTAHKTLCKSGLVRAVKSDKVITPPDYLGSKEVGYMFDTEEKDLRQALRDVYENYNDYLAKAKESREWVKQFEIEALTPAFLTLAKPEKVVLGQNNLLENGTLTTTSKNLYEKYSKLIAQ